MALDNAYSFDDCSILKLCEIKIPKAYQIFFDKTTLTVKNYSKLKTALKKLDNHNIPKFRFVPSENIEGNIIHYYKNGDKIHRIAAVEDSKLLAAGDNSNEEIINKSQVKGILVLVLYK